jgi:hypothetical protein
MMGICERLAASIADPRDPVRVVHGLEDILQARIFAIACGYNTMSRPARLMPPAPL